MPDIAQSDPPVRREAQTDYRVCSITDRHLTCRPEHRCVQHRQSDFRCQMLDIGMGCCTLGELRSCKALQLTHAHIFVPGDV